MVIVLRIMFGGGVNLLLEVKEVYEIVLIILRE